MDSNSFKLKEPKFHRNHKIVNKTTTSLRDTKLEDDSALLIGTRIDVLPSKYDNVEIKEE